MPDRQGPSADWPRLRAVLAPFFGNPKSGGVLGAETDGARADQARGKSPAIARSAALQKHSKSKARAEQMHAQSQSELQHDDDGRATANPSVGSPSLSAKTRSGCRRDRKTLRPRARRRCLPPLGRRRDAGAELAEPGLDVPSRSPRRAAARWRTSAADGPNSITYFEKGIAEFVARDAAPVPRSVRTWRSRMDENSARTNSGVAERDALLEQREGRRDRESWSTRWWGACDRLRSTSCMFICGRGKNVRAVIRSRPAATSPTRRRLSGDRAVCAVARVVAPRTRSRGAAVSPASASARRGSAGSRRSGAEAEDAGPRPSYEELQRRCAALGLVIGAARPPAFDAEAESERVRNSTEFPKRPGTRCRVWMAEPCRPTRP